MLFSRHTKRRQFIAVIGGPGAWTTAARAPVDPVAGTSLTRTDHLVALASLLLIVVLLWAPFGPRVGLTFEEWKALYWTVEGGGIPVLFPNRPLHYLPNSLAHLTGRPLEALNLMQASSIFGRGALVYLLMVRMLPTAGQWPFLRECWRSCIRRTRDSSLSAPWRSTWLSCCPWWQFTFSCPSGSAFDGGSSPPSGWRRG
jgi:hypothetical protein